MKSREDILRYKREYYRKNKAKLNKYYKDYYPKNKQDYHKSVVKRRNKRREFIIRYKNLPGVKCKICGEGRWQCLEFHHRDKTQKSDHVSNMVGRKVSMKTLKNEIRKCDVLCCNCHRVLENGFRWDGKCKTTKLDKLKKIEKKTTLDIDYVI